MSTRREPWAQLVLNKINDDDDDEDAFDLGVDSKSERISLLVWDQVYIVSISRLIKLF